MQEVKGKFALTIQVECDVGALSVADVERDFSTMTTKFGFDYVEINFRAHNNKYKDGLSLIWFIDAVLDVFNPITTNALAAQICGFLVHNGYIINSHRLSFISASNAV